MGRVLTKGRRAVPVTAYLDERQADALRHLTAKTGVPSAEFIRRGITQGAFRMNQTQLDGMQDKRDEVLSRLAKEYEEILAKKKLATKEAKQKHDVIAIKLKERNRLSYRCPDTKITISLDTSSKVRLEAPKGKVASTPSSESKKKPEAKKNGKAAEA